MDWTTLTGAKTAAGSLRRAINYAELDSDAVLEDAQGLLFQTLRVREMRASSTLTLNVGDSLKALPAGFLDPIGYITDTDNNRYTQRTQGYIIGERAYDSNRVLVSGQPTCFAIFDEALQFDVSFDTGRVLNLLYYKTPALLSASNTTNFLTTRWPHLLRTACLVGAHEFKKDWDAANTYRQRLDALIQVTNMESDLSYRGADLDVREAY